MQCADAIVARVGALNHEEAMARCPGAGSCHLYDSAAGETPEEKADACRSCTRCEGRPPMPPADSDFCAAVVSEVEGLVNERAAGRVFMLAELDPLMWELMCLWQAQQAAFERAHQARLRQVIEHLMKRNG